MSNAATAGMYRGVGSSWTVRWLVAAVMLACGWVPLGWAQAAGERTVGVRPVEASLRQGNAGLFVGVNEFEDESLRTLRFAVNDAVAQAHLFVLELRVIPPANATLLLSGEPGTEATRAQKAALEAAGVRIGRANRTRVFNELARTARLPEARTDLVLVSLSSHGFEQEGVPYVMPADGSRSFLRDTGVPLGTIEDRLSKSEAGKRLLIVDACREKASADGKNIGRGMDQGWRQALAQARGQAVLASCDVGQFSYEDVKLGHGVFTHQLLGGLRGQAGADERGFITLGTVSDYVARAVNEWVRRNKYGSDAEEAQKPWFKGPNDAREIPLAVKVAGLPPTLPAKPPVLEVFVTVERIKVGEGTDHVVTIINEGTTDDTNLKADMVFPGGLDPISGSGDTAVTVAGRTVSFGVYPRLGPKQAIRWSVKARGAAAGEARVRTFYVSDSAKEAVTKEANVLVAGLPPPEPPPVAGGPAGATKERPWENTLGMKFVPVAGTEVLFGMWDVRVQDYAAFASATSRKVEKPSFEQGPTHPVVNVSWEDAQAFAKWLTEKERREGKLTVGQSYRLPQHWEWSVAVGLDETRGGTPETKKREIKGVYPWGTRWPPPSGAGNYFPPLNVDSFAETSPVGSFTANQFGLYDMGGNVWQWCEDYYSGNSGTRARSLRGGSWRDGNPVNLLSSYCEVCAPVVRRRDFGFRLVLVVGGLP